MDYPTLYGKPSSGDKIKRWNIKVVLEDNTFFIERSFGYVNGKMTVSRREIRSGKNLGKKNETTPYEQACNEAQSLWRKQVESGYSINFYDHQKDNQVLPMLAHDYNKRSKDINTSNYCIQPKIDGIRLLVTVKNNEVVFQSRTGKPIEVIEHIKNDLQHMGLLQDGVYLDGELFTFELPFEQISGLFRTSKGDKTNMKFLNYYIFDCYHTNTTSIKTFQERYNYLRDRVSKSKNIKFVDTHFFKNDNRNIEFVIEDFHSKYIQKGYEGIMIRNTESEYKPNYRSKDLQKYKKFVDKEFVIVGGKEASGEDKGTVIFECKTDDDKLFSVRPRGSRELRAHMYENLDSFIGKQLTVRYQNLSELNVPRFPVGISVRDYE